MRYNAAMSAAPPLPFKYIGGDLSIDFVNTIDWTMPRPTNERLRDRLRLIEWAEGAGVVASRDADALRRAARANPATADAVLVKAIELRAVIQRVYAGARSAEAWREFNEYFAEAAGHLRVAPLPGRAARWGWSDEPGRMDVILWHVVWAAAQLLVSDEAAQVRICAADNCRWMYVDRSRNGLRRWCAMETCGTAEKSRRRREKRD